MRGRDGPPDKRLFRRARQGDRQAFLLLVRRYDPRLRRLVLRLVAESERVDPILRRAYVKAWRSLPMVELPGSVAEWLYRVVYNACVNELRWAPERPPPEPVQGPRVPLPVASAERRLAGLRALTAEERIPLALVDGEGFSLEATARILQRPPVAVAADLSRARGRWRSFVVGDGRPGHDAPEVVELEPDTAAAEAEADADPVSADAEPSEGGSQPRHVRVVTPAPRDGNGHDPSASVDVAEDDLGHEPLDDAAQASATASAAPSPAEAPTTDGAVPDAAPGPEQAVPPTTDGAVPDVAAGPEQAAPPPKATGSAPPAGDADPAPKPASKNGETASGSSQPAPSTGAAPRRKRRRETKRDVSTRAARSATSKATGPDAGTSDGDSDAPTRRDESHEAT